MTDLHGWIVANSTGSSERTIDMAAVGHRMAGKVVVQKAQLDLFLCQLQAELAAGNIPPHLVEAFVEAFPGSSTREYVPELP